MQSVLYRLLHYALFEIVNTSSNLFCHMLQPMRISYCLIMFIEYHINVHIILIIKFNTTK